MKDPAVLIYFDKWIAATNGMRADFRAWYFDLLLYQYDKGFIPNDEDELCGICRVRPSEQANFKQMVEQVLKQKFKQTELGWSNEVMMDVIRKREAFKEKRAKSGNIGVVIKLAHTIKGFNNKHIERLKRNLYQLSIDEVEKHKDKHVLNHLLKLYIDVDEDVDINTKSNSIKVETSEDQKNLNNIIQQNYPQLLDFKNPLTIEQFRKLKEEFGTNILDSKMRDLSNYNGASKKYINAYHTLLEWCKRQKMKV